MKKILQTILILLFAQCASTLVQSFNETIIFENSIVQVRLLCQETASIDQPDWLKLCIKNKTSSPLLIHEINYAINKDSIPSNARNLLEYGHLGQGDKYVLLPAYYNLQPGIVCERIAIQPHDQLVSSKYITNNASAYLNRVSTLQNICPYFKLKLTYTIDNQYGEIENQGTPFCFYWKPDTQVAIADQANRLRAVLKDVYYQPVNYQLIYRLINAAAVAAQITDDELFEAASARQKYPPTEESRLVMSLLCKRKVKPNPRLTEIYKNVLQDVKMQSHYELGSYWDNALFDDLLSSPWEQHIRIRLLDWNAPSWSTVPGNTAKVYDWLTNKLKFDPGVIPSQGNYNTWNQSIRTMSVSRDQRIIDYLIPLLDTEQEYDVEDWSKYEMMGSLPKNPKPDIIKIRVCDVAFVSLLRAIGKTNYNTRENIDPEFMALCKLRTSLHHSLAVDYNLDNAMKRIIMTPAAKTKILAAVGR